MLLTRLAAISDAELIAAYGHAMFSEMGKGQLAGLDAMRRNFVPWVKHMIGCGKYSAGSWKTAVGLSRQAGSLSWSGRPIRSIRQASTAVTCSTSGSSRRIANKGWRGDWCTKRWRSRGDAGFE